MTARSTPWDEIATPESDYNVRLIAGSSAISMYWGKDINGCCLFLIELEGDHSKKFQKDGPSVHGINVDLRGGSASQLQGLVLTLENQVDRDLFSGLCQTLVSNLQSVTDASTALAVALMHIKRWKAFLAGRKRRVLSPAEVRGLFAELQFLRLLYGRHLTQPEAVNAWCGPEGVHQDFIFEDTAVEIKSLSGRERNSVRISSEDQLEALSDNLFLMIFRLTEQPDADQSLSLNLLISQIEQEITDSQALEEFSMKLAANGYVEMREYDAPVFLVSGQKCYRVCDEFPRLVRSELADGIMRVGYEIELESISEFECDTSEIWSD